MDFGMKNLKTFLYSSDPFAYLFTLLFLPEDTRFCLLSPGLLAFLHFLLISHFLFEEVFFKVA